MSENSISNFIGTMDEKVLFTLLGVIITLLIGWLNMRRQTRYDSLKICADKLISERIKVYPALYKIISDAIKNIDFEHKIDLQQLEEQLNRWDSENAIFLAQFSGDRAVELRYHLRKVLDREIKDYQYRELREKLIELEIGLRVDLSIYALEAGRVRRAYRGSQRRIRKLTSRLWQP